MTLRAPRLLGYETWCDDTLVYVARWLEDLPEEALAAGCLRQVAAADELTFRQVAVRNRIRIEDWLSRQRLTAHAGEIRKPGRQDPGP